MRVQLGDERRRRSEVNGQSADDARWDAVLHRDESQDGAFYYAVSTTGVYCKPSCSSRRPLRENVAFYSSRDDVERAGYRACKRCKPGMRSAELQKAKQVESLCRLIERSSEEPTLTQLASSIGVSASHAQRMFKELVGISPKQYANAHRRNRLGSDLLSSSSVTEAIYRSGFGSPARFYASANKSLGMSPRVYREGGRDACIRFAIAESCLGPVLVAATEKGLCCIMLDDDPQFLIDELARRFPAATLVGAERDFDEVVAKVVGLVQRPGDDLRLPLDIRGTAFQERVWRALMDIPPGKTANYAEIAEKLGQPTAARAVAGACAGNHLALVVPCHRVVRRDGGLSGYRWGVERKRKLLEWERDLK